MKSRTETKTLKKASTLHSRSVTRQLLALLESSIVCCFPCNRLQSTQTHNYSSLKGTQRQVCTMSRLLWHTGPVFHISTAETLIQQRRTFLPPTCGDQWCSDRTHRDVMTLTSKRASTWNSRLVKWGQIPISVFPNNKYHHTILQVKMSFVTAVSLIP